MENSGKEVLLKAAIDIGKLYAFLAQALRVIIDPEAKKGMSGSLFNEQLDKIRKDLEPILSKNQIVQKNLSAIDQRVMKIREAAENADETKRKDAIEEARRYLKTIEERTSTLSDLVALFRRL